MLLENIAANPKIHDDDTWVEALLPFVRHPDVNAA